MVFKDRLKELRERKGLSQAELAKKLDLSKSTISMLESGSRQPSIEVMESIADLFNVSFDYLSGRDDISMYYLEPRVRDIAMLVAEDKDLYLLLERARDNNYRDRLIQIMNLMENSK